MCGVVPDWFPNKPGQVVQVPPYRGLYQCPILCLFTCTTLYRSVPPRCKPIDIRLSVVQGGTNWYNRVSCKWYKGWYKAFRFVPLGEVVRRLQQPHPGVGNTHRKPLLALGYTTQSRNCTTQSPQTLNTQGFYSTPKHNHKYRGRLIQTYRGRVPRHTPSRANLDTLQTLIGIGLYGLHPLALTRGCLITGYLAASKNPCRSPHTQGRLRTPAYPTNRQCALGWCSGGWPCPGQFRHIGKLTPPL